MTNKEMRDNWIWFDMDGTLVDFYGVEGWLECLQKNDATPYRIAKPKYEISQMRDLINTLHLMEYHIGIISWSSKALNPQFDIEVTKAKREWLSNRGLLRLFDEIIVTPYGVSKNDTCAQYGTGILVDDEERNRREWGLGLSIDANKNILSELSELLLR